MANRQSWLVEYLSEAVVEVQGLSKKDLLGVLNAVDKLRQLGSQPAWLARRRAELYDIGLARK